MLVELIFKGQDPLYVKQMQTFQIYKKGIWASEGDQIPH